MTTATIKTYLVLSREGSFEGADFVVNAIQVDGYDPCTIIDFESEKYGLRQTIADTLHRRYNAHCVPSQEGLADDMEEVCPDAWLLNYTNPMSMLTGYMLRYTGVKTVGLCHVQVCQTVF